MCTKSGNVFLNVAEGAGESDLAEIVCQAVIKVACDNKLSDIPNLGLYCSNDGLIRCIECEERLYNLDIRGIAITPAGLQCNEIEGNP